MSEYWTCMISYVFIVIFYSKKVPIFFSLTRFVKAVIIEW